MGANPPKLIADISFLGHEVTRCDYLIHVAPNSDSTGYINSDINHKIEIPSDKIFLLSTKLELKAFEGDPKEQKDSDPHIFSLDIDLLLRYSINNIDDAETKIKRYEWHYRSHAMILIHNISRDIMKDTRFRVLEKSF